MKNERDQQMCYISPEVIKSTGKRYVSALILQTTESGNDMKM